MFRDEGHAGGPAANKDEREDHLWENRAVHLQEAGPFGVVAHVARAGEVDVKVEAGGTAHGPRDGRLETNTGRREGLVIMAFRDGGGFCRCRRLCARDGRLLEGHLWVTIVVAGVFLGHCEDSMDDGCPGVTNNYKTLVGQRMVSLSRAFFFSDEQDVLGWRWTTRFI